VCLDTIERLKETGQIKPGDEVVVFNTGAAQKYLEAVPLSLPRLDKDRPMKLE
jgi:threonine synthase